MSVKGLQDGVDRGRFGSILDVLSLFNHLVSGTKSGLKDSSNYTGYQEGGREKDKDRVYFIQSLSKFLRCPAIAGGDYGGNKSI
jgi:hypothetical protein